MLFSKRVLFTLLVFVAASTIGCAAQQTPKRFHSPRAEAWEKMTGGGVFSECSEVSPVGTPTQDSRSFKMTCADSSVRLELKRPPSMPARDFKTGEFRLSLLVSAGVKELEKGAAIPNLYVQPHSNAIFSSGTKETVIDRGYISLFKE